MIADEEGKRLHQQIVEIRPLYLDIDRPVRVQILVRPFQLDVKPDVGCAVAINDLDLAIGTVIFAIRSLEQEFLRI